MKEFNTKDIELLSFKEMGYGFLIYASGVIAGAVGRPWSIIISIIAGVVVGRRARRLFDYNR